MSIKDDLNMYPLAEGYFFANTPNFLFHHFRSEQTVRDLISKYPPELLTEEYITLTCKDERSVEDIIVSYAILVAFTFLETSVATDIFQNLDLTLLDWGKDIQKYFSNLDRFDEIYIPPKIMDLRYQNPITSSNREDTLIIPTPIKTSEE